MIKWLRLFLVFPLLSLLPPRLAYRLAALAYRFDPILRGPTRLAVSMGMRQVLPDADDPRKLSRLLNDYQGMMGRELLDVYYLPRLSANSVDRWVDVNGLDLLKNPRPEGRGRILVMAHFSRPSLLFAALSLKGVKLHILTQAIDITNPELDVADRQFLRFKVWGNRRHMLGEWITVNDNPRFMYERLRVGETVVILFDVRATAGERTFRVPFLGHTLVVPQGVQRLAQKTGAALYYGGIRDHGWRARISIDELAGETADDAMKAATLRLEQEIRGCPAQWWQWNIFDYLVQAPSGEDSADTA